ncbi:MAG: helix-turn-helix domain-containing protein [Candidatus Omnitrophica bacterium]|nr:helix-turn-helix domain-containing protein [Candidatus Omnitrophota bacterium]
MPTTQEVLTVEELADYLQIKTSTIYKHAQHGQIPCFKIGSAWRFKKSSIDDWIKGQEKSNAKQPGASMPINTN